MMLRISDYLTGLATTAFVVFLVMTFAPQQRPVEQPAPRSAAPTARVPDVDVWQQVDGDTIDVPLPSGPFRGISQRVVIVGGRIESATVTVER